MDIFEFKIIKIDWTLGPTGIVVPILTLTNNKKASCSYKFFIDNALQRGDMVTLQGNSILEKTSKQSNPISIIENCPACNSKLIVDNDNLCCQNVDCPALARSTVTRLCSIVNNINVDNWLDKFPMGHGQTFKIQSIFEFLPLFSQIRGRNTYVRDDLLKTYFGDREGHELWLFENKLEAKLKLGFLISEFWYIINLPGINFDTAQLLKKVNPRTELKKITEIVSKNINWKVASIIKKNKDYWGKILKLVKVEDN